MNKEQKKMIFGFAQLVMIAMFMIPLIGASVSADQHSLRKPETQPTLRLGCPSHWEEFRPYEIWVFYHNIFHYQESYLHIYIQYPDHTESWNSQISEQAGSIHFWRNSVRGDVTVIVSLIYDGTIIDQVTRKVVVYPPVGPDEGPDHV